MSVKDMTENLHRRIDAVTAAAYKAGQLEGFRRGKEVGLDENEGYGAGFSYGRTVEKSRIIQHIREHIGFGDEEEDNFYKVLIGSIEDMK